MPRRLQCIFCQYTFIIPDDGRPLEDCPSCGTELLDNTYIVDLGPVTDPGPLDSTSTLEQPLSAEATRSQAIDLDATVPVPAFSEADLEEENADFEDVTSAGFDDDRPVEAQAASGGLEASSTLEMSPAQREDEISFGMLDEPAASEGGNGVTAVRTTASNPFEFEEPTDVHAISATVTAASTMDKVPMAALPSAVIESQSTRHEDDDDEPIYYPDEATVSKNLDLEALAAVSPRAANRRPRWRCTSCLAEFPGSRPQTCPACGSAL